MRTDVTKKRTFLICGHSQSGKTSLSDAILFKCGANSRLGRVDDGTSVSDYEEDEKQRKSSVNLSVMNAEYKGNFLQFVDVPGYLDFVGEVIATGRAVDFAVMVVDAVDGCGVGTEKAWDVIKRENIPCCFFINKLDKENTDAEATLADIKNSLTKNAVPFAVYAGGKVKLVLSDKNDPNYGPLIEKIAESDDALLEKYLEKGAVEDSEVGPALKKAIGSGNLCPVISGVAIQELGTEALLDLISGYMPSPLEAVRRKAKKGENEIVLEPKTDGGLVAQVFKTVIDPFVGQLSIFRVYSGKLVSNSEIYISGKGREKVGQVFILQGKQQVAQDGVCAGEIGALAKLKEVATLDVLCDTKDEIALPAITFPSPAYSASVKPHSRQDEDKISSALGRLMIEDPTFKVSVDPQTKEMIISGMGELHLHVIIERMTRKYGANVDLGTPKVPYKETVTRKVSVQGKHKKQTGGHGQYGDCWLEIEPMERGQDFEFVNRIVGGAIPRNFIPSVEKGVRKAMEEGILAGYHVSDVRVTLFDGSYHDVDSSDMAFQIAGSMAFKKAMEQAGCVLLEPIMDVEIAVPGEFMGQVTGDINSRRGRVMGMEARGKNEVVKARIPLAEMFKYASDLRSFTGGRGSYSMTFSTYEVVPARIAQGVIEQSKRVQEKEEAHA